MLYFFVRVIDTIGFNTCILLLQRHYNGNIHFCQNTIHLLKLLSIDNSFIVDTITVDIMQLKAKYSNSTLNQN